jgi:hypothetical protein
MTTTIFVLAAILMCMATVFYIRAFVWIMSKGSPTSQFIVAVASVVFCLVMAKSNVDQDMFFTVMFLVASPFYIWMAIRAFNKLVPTKEQ